MYDFKKIEKKWQDNWEKEKTFKVVEDEKKEKWYGLIEFPYPSRTRTTRWTSKKLYCYRYNFKKKKNARIQCFVSYWI